jgi:hypothetical protein
MRYTVNIDEVVGGFKIEIEDETEDETRDMMAFAALPHQVPQRVKDLFEILYPRKEKKA